MNTPEDIRDQVELYLRGELDPKQAGETAGLIQSDPAWQEIHAQLLVERRGIRFHSLQSFKNNLFEYEAELTNQEKKQEKGGDLSRVAAFTYTTNVEKGVEVKTQSHEMEENYSIDQNTEKGIRYTSLRGQLEKLKQEEEGMGGSSLPKKNRGIVVGMKRYWWVAAAGVMVIIIGWNLLANKQFNDLQDLIILPEQVYTTRTNSNVDLKTSAYLQYSNGKYSAAHNYFSLLDQTNDLTIEDELYFAFCKLKLNKFDQAEILIKKAKENQFNQYDLDYFISICEISKNNFNEAKNILLLSAKSRDTILNNKLLSFLNNKIK